MLAAVNGLRFAAATMALAAAVLGPSCSGPDMPDCALPTLTETAVDGGPDPCHCAPPPSLNLQACPCLSGDQNYIDAYNACLALYRDEMDAGAD
jgi:hypothetical protein